MYGLLGFPVAQSLSPAMHNAAFRALGLDAVYVPFPTAPERLEAAVVGLQAAGVRGVNLTVPHKTAILPLLDEVLPEARAVGAVNTVRLYDGRLTGTNTDGLGFLLSLRHDLDYAAAGKTVLLLGAGGAARGIAFALLDAGVAALWIANRSGARADALVADCRTLHPAAQVEARPWPALAGVQPHLLVNATTVGMGDGASPVALEAVAVREAVIDIVYHPLETPLLAEARRLGLPCANGIGMLLYQGAAAFQFWTDREAPVDVMRAALLSGMGHA
ncbi:MAG: shikimate dehydrogenase [Gammaproteobacteria bacterium]|nr:shikimate dehydrogenase [Gammaproteobacteria bacterium]